MAEILRRYGYEARRGSQSRGGKEEPDVVCSLPGYRLEVKWVEKLNIHAAFRQCDDDIDPADDDTVPAVVHHKSRGPVLITLPFEDFLEAIK